MHPGSSRDCASGDQLKRGARVDVLPLVCMDDTDPVYSDCRTKPDGCILIFGVLSLNRTTMRVVVRSSANILIRVAMTRSGRMREIANCSVDIQRDRAG